MPYPPRRRLLGDSVRSLGHNWMGWNVTHEWEGFKLGWQVEHIVFWTPGTAWNLGPSWKIYGGLFRMNGNLWPTWSPRSKVKTIQKWHVQFSLHKKLAVITNYEILGVQLNITEAEARRYPRFRIVACPFRHPLGTISYHCPEGMNTFEAPIQTYIQKPYCFEHNKWYNMI